MYVIKYGFPRLWFPSDLLLVLGSWVGILKMGETFKRSVRRGNEAVMEALTNEAHSFIHQVVSRRRLERLRGA